MHYGFAGIAAFMARDPLRMRDSSTALLVTATLAVLFLLARSFRFSPLITSTALNFVGLCFLHRWHFFFSM